MGAPYIYIYDISRLRVNVGTLIFFTIRFFAYVLGVYMWIQYSRYWWKQRDLEWRCPLIICKNNYPRWIFRILVTRTRKYVAVLHSLTAVSIRCHWFFTALKPFETWISSKLYVKISSHLTVNILRQHRKACFLMLHKQPPWAPYKTQIRRVEKCRYLFGIPPFFTSWWFLRWSVNFPYFVESERLFIYRHRGTGGSWPEPDEFGSFLAVWFL